MYLLFVFMVISAIECGRMSSLIQQLFAAAIRLPIRCSQDAHNAILRSRKKDSTPLLLALMGLSLDNSIGVKSRRWLE